MSKKRPRLQAKEVPNDDNDSASTTTTVVPLKKSKWFKSKEDYLLYYEDIGNRTLLQPLWMNFDFFANEGFHFQNIIEEMGLKTFAGLKNSHCKELLTAFLVGFQKSPDGVLFTTLVNRTINLTPEVWFSVTGLQNKGVTINPNNPKEFGKICNISYNRSNAIKPFLKDPFSFAVKKLPKRVPVSLLTCEGRLLHYAIVTIIYPRKLKHTVVLDEDIMLMFCLWKRVRVNWIWLFGERLLECKEKKDCEIPYGNLIGAFLDYFNFVMEGVYLKFYIGRFDSEILAIVKIKKIDGIWYSEGIPIRKDPCSPHPSVEPNRPLENEGDALVLQSNQQEDDRSGSGNSRVHEFTDPPGSGKCSVPEYMDPFQRYVVEQFAALERMMTQGFDSLSRKIELLSKKIDEKKI